MSTASNSYGAKSQDKLLPSHWMASSTLSLTFKFLSYFIQSFACWMEEQCPYIETRMAKLLSRASCFRGTDEAWQIFLSINRNRMMELVQASIWQSAQIHFLCSAANVTTLWRFDTFKSFQLNLNSVQAKCSVYDFLNNTREIRINGARGANHLHRTFLAQVQTFVSVKPGQCKHQ